VARTERCTRILGITVGLKPFQSPAGFLQFAPHNESGDFVGVSAIPQPPKPPR
jgi:hypothetical protein